MFAVLIVTSLLVPERFLAVTSAINTQILDRLVYGFAGATFLFVLTCLWAAASPLGAIRIGGKDAKPILSKWNWMAITLTTTVAIGILFWATAEPIYHLADPGGLDTPPGSERAGRFALSSLFMHWAISPYAIYTIPGLTFALAYHNWHLPFSLASPFRAMRGRAVPRAVGDGLDGLAVLSLLFGLAASLGAGILSLAGGLDRLAGTGSGPWVTGLFALLVISGFAISSASGLQRGIRILSDINTRLFVLFMIAVFLMGPTAKIIMAGAQAILDYGREFVPRSLMLPPFDDQDWAKAWTVFYFANWLAWAPLAAMFLGRISRGYTVRTYILVNLVLPALFSMIWMTIFGGFSIILETETQGRLTAVMDAGGPERVLYAVLDALPAGAALAAVIVVLTYLSYVTAADSSTTVLAQITDHDSEPRPDGVQPKRAGPKIAFAVVVGLAAWSMVTLSGIDGVRMLSNLGGLPALFIVSAFNITLIWMGTKGLRYLRAS